MSDYLCSELIFEIFTRLPPKSLLRFRSLSKSWCSCICSPGFIRMHTLRSPQKLLIRHRHPEYPDTTSCCLPKGFYTIHSEDRLPLSPRRGYKDISQVESPCSRNSYIVGSCNGILCVIDHEGSGISLWNPSIGRQLVVLGCPRRCSSWVVRGFGFDPITEDYKIVTICFSSKENGGKVESSVVYAMKTGTWCVIASLIPLFTYVASKACFVNGALHWVVKRCNTELLEDYFYILTFDLSTHIFGTILLPQPSYKAPRLTTIQGSLVVISAVDDDNSWIRAKRDASWSVVLKLKTDQVVGDITAILQPRIDGDMLLFYNRLGVYNPKIGAQSRLVNFNASSFIVDIEMYAESLHLLDIESASNQVSPLGTKK